MKKLLVLLALIAVLLLGYIAAGPFMTVNAIREAVKAQDTAALSEHVDYPALRSNITAQLDDQLARRAGPDIQANPLGAIALRIVGGIAGGTVDAIVTPAGIGALLEGRNLWHRATGTGINDHDSYEHTAPSDPLKDAKYRFESPSRFTATVHGENGRPVVFVFNRHRLQWKLSDIRLPFGDAGE